MKEAQKSIHALADHFRVKKPRKYRLKDCDPGETCGMESEEDGREYLAHGVELLSELQEKLYAQDKWAVLLIFQAMDAAGKDGVIKHVMTGINPQGCQVSSFKAPTSTE